MNARLVEILALISASQARVAGMQAHDLHKQLIGSSEIYDESAYENEAALLESLASEARNAQ
jgi:hypothetical protein